MKALDRNAIDPDADRVVRRLTKEGHTAYLVGGCVRDLLLGRKPKDFDVATSATPNEVRSIFRNCRIIGRRFRLATVYFGDKIIETATFRANPRSDEVDGGGAGELLIRRDNVFGSETDDARRRDFTVNGLFYDVEAEKVIDHVSGLGDLQRRQIRTIGDPEVRFQEDPIRMLRAVKFAARLTFEIEPVTYKALLRWRHELRKAAPPRVLEEVYRLLRGGAAKRSMELLVETGILPLLSTQLAELFQGDGAPALSMPRDVGPPPVRRIDLAPVDDEGVGDDEDYDLDGGSTDDEPDVGDLFVPMPLDDSGQPLRELDDAEREWRRLWFAKPTDAVAAEPGVSSVPGDPALAKPRAAGWQMLTDLDNAIAGDHDPGNAVVLAALILPFVSEALTKGRPAEAHNAVTAWSLPLIEQLRVTRRDSERIRQLLLAQRRIAIAASRGEKAEPTGSREFVAEALLLASLTGILSSDNSSVTAAPDDSSDEQLEDDGTGRKRRRRRRGGRRRRRDSAGDGAA